MRKVVAFLSIIILLTGCLAKQGQIIYIRNAQGNQILSDKLKKNTIISDYNGYGVRNVEWTDSNGNYKIYKLDKGQYYEVK